MAANAVKLDRWQLYWLHIKESIKQFKTINDELAKNEATINEAIANRHARGQSAEAELTIDLKMTEHLKLSVKIKDQCSVKM